MLTDVPFAQVYKLMPIEDPTIHIVIGDARPCGVPPVGRPPLTFSQLLMEQIGRIMEDSDVVGYGGISGGLMMIIVKISKDVCYKLLDGALLSVNEIFKDNPDLIPEGGLAFQLRDWDDIPDDEKAGHEKC